MKDTKKYSFSIKLEIMGFLTIKLIRPLKTDADIWHICHLLRTSEKDKLQSNICERVKFYSQCDKKAKRMT